MHFGATLRLLRSSAGVSLSGLAARVGVSSAYLSRVEHGHDAPPTAERLQTIAVALGLAPDRLLDLVDELRPDAIAWLDRAPEGRQLAAELRRRSLGAAQVARVIRFVRKEFPIEGDAAPELGLDPTRVLLGVEVGTLRDALEIAALRLGGRELVAELRSPEHASPLGGGLLVAHGPGSRPRACLIMPASPLEHPTPDGLALRVVLAITGPELTGMLVQAARLADRRLVDRIVAATSGDEVVGAVQEWLGRA